MDKSAGGWRRKTSLEHKNLEFDVNLMKTKGSTILIALLLFALAGCEETAKHAIRVQPPQATATPPLEVSTNLPLNRSPLGRRTFTPPPRSAEDVLIQAVEEAFRSGEQNYKAGHLEKARKDFDRAVDWMLARLLRR